MRAPLSPTDEHLVGLLGAHRVLTTHQVAAATAVPQRTAEYRLDRLRQRGLVERARPYRERGSAPYHWWLTRTGLGVAHRTPPGRGRTPEPNPLFLGHATATAGFALALQAHGPDVGLVLGEWLRDEDGWEEWRAEGRTFRVAPDGMLAATARGQAVRAFVEIDLGTMTQRRLRHKMLRYLRYAHDECWRDRHPHCPAVLVVTTSEERAERLLAGVDVLRRRQRSPTNSTGRALDRARHLLLSPDTTRQARRDHEATQACLEYGAPNRTISNNHRLHQFPESGLLERRAPATIRSTSLNTQRFFVTAGTPPDATPNRGGSVVTHATLFARRWHRTNTLPGG